MGAPRVLVVDDEPKIRDVLSRYLVADGFEVSQSGDGDEALAMVSRLRPEVVILDVRLPGRDGFAVLAELRRVSNAYVIMLTARAEEIDKVLGLSLGADDYVTKPFSPREVAARVRAVLRRSRRPPSESDVIEVGALRIDGPGRIIVFRGREVSVTTLEFDLLLALATSPGRVFTRRQLLERVWGWDFFGDERVVDVHIRNLRNRLGDDAQDPAVVATVRGVGYKMVEEPR